MATPASSGDPHDPVPHIALKPQAPGIETNLTIYTTRHIYHVVLRSHGRAMQEVEFYYPDELLAAMRDADANAAKAKQENAQETAVDPPGDAGGSGPGPRARAHRHPAVRDGTGNGCAPSRCPARERMRLAGR